MGLRKFGAGDILNTDPKKKTAAKKQLTPEEAAAIRDEGDESREHQARS